MLEETIGRAHPRQRADAARPITEQPKQKQPKATGLPAQQNRWRRVWATPTMMHYNRLIAVVAVVNLALLVFGAAQGMWWTGSGIALPTLSNLVLANLALAILIRQQYVINLLFKIATSVPTSWPLAIRRIMGKVYHFGGLHVGGAVVGTIWFALFAGSLSYHLANRLPGVSIATVGATYALLAVLIFMIVMARPSVRARFHDQFEMAHRFGGWAALLLFWAQTLLFVNDQRGQAA
ncbi:MAG: hypothetical protein ACRDIB_04690, partial [Ardenticatenaceae bacterium]